MQKNNIFLAISFLLLPASVVVAQEPTIDSAQEFLMQTLGKGSTKVSSPGFSLGGVIISDQAFAHVYKISGTNCLTTFMFSLGNSDGVNKTSPLTISWDKVSEVKFEGGVDNRITVIGASGYATQVTNSSVLAIESEAMARRVVNAMEFLRKSCDKFSSTGF